MLTISLILLPLLLSIFLFFLKEYRWIKWTALATSLIELGIVLYALVGFNSQIARDYTFHLSWIPTMGINFSFGMTGLGILLVLLTAVLVPIIMWISFRQKVEKSGSFYALICFMEAALIGVFTSCDGLLFYIFWELALLPIYFICALWGGENRIRITLKFFIYTMLGSLFMLAGLIWLYLKTPYPHSFDIAAIAHVCLSLNEQIWILGFFFLAFAIKIPIFPFHSWQPDTYTVAPFAGSMLLAGIMLKMGLYGIIVFLLPTCAGILHFIAPYLIILSLTGVLYGSVIAIGQKEIKRLIAYSSLSHVGLMAAALFSFQLDGLQGTIFQMLSHGCNVVALFFVAEIIYCRTGTLTISDLGGIARSAPKFAIFFMIVLLGTVALPLTNGFVGEFMMLSGIVQYNLVLGGIAGISIILGAVYMFSLYQHTMYGESGLRSGNFTDLNKNELIIAIPMVIFILAMGIYPKPLLEISKPTVEALLSLVGN